MGLTHSIFMTCSYFPQLSVIGVDCSSWGHLEPEGSASPRPRVPLFPCSSFSLVAALHLFFVVGVRAGESDGNSYSTFSFLRVLNRVFPGRGLKLWTKWDFRVVGYCHQPVAFV